MYQDNDGDPVAGVVDVVMKVVRLDDVDGDVESRSRQSRGAVADGDVDDGKPWPGHPRVPRLRGLAPLTLCTRLRSLQQENYHQ